jgi:hypothetical protein
MSMTNEDIKYYSNIHSKATKDFEQIGLLCKSVLICNSYQWSMDYMLSLNCVGIIFFMHSTDEFEANTIHEAIKSLDLNYEYDFKVCTGGISVEFKTNPLVERVEQAIA